MITRERVEDALLEMGMQIGLCGFDYISDAIMLISETNSRQINMYILYCLVARRNDTTWMAVESGIRYAFSRVRRKEKFRSVVEHYIGIENKTNTDSLRMLYRALEIEQKGGAAA